MSRGKQKKKKTTHTERWYYDACALETGIIYDEIINNTRSSRKLTASFLSLGEAYGNCFREDKDESAPSKFVQLIEKLRNVGKLDIISNAQINKAFNFVKEVCDKLEVADAMHLATALQNKCNILRSFDRHFIKLTKEQKDRLAERFELNNGFAVQSKNTPVK